MKYATDNFKNKLSNLFNIPLGQRILTQNLYEEVYTEVRIFSSPLNDLGVRWVPGALPSGTNWPWNEADHSNSPGVEIKNTSTLHTS